MSKASRKPRRERVEQNIYRRTNAKGREVLEVGYKDGAGKQRWRTVEGGLKDARALRRELLHKRDRGERVAPNVRLRFGEAADRWLNGPVLDLRPSTQAGYRNAVERHLRPRFATRRLDAIDADDLATLVRELRAAGKSEATIVVVIGVANRIYRYAARRLAWAGTNPVSILLSSERPKPSQAQRKRLFEADALTQTIAAARRPYKALLTLAALTGARMSELLALTWEDVRIANVDDAEVEFGWQVDRHGNRQPTKTDGSARTVPIPCQLAVILAEHKLASRDTRPESYGSPPARDGRSRSATWPARCARRRRAPVTSRGDRHSRSSTSGTTTSPCPSHVAPCRRCTASATPSPAVRCSPASQSMRSRSCSATATPTSPARSTCARLRTLAAVRCAGIGWRASLEASWKPHRSRLHL